MGEFFDRGRNSRLSPAPPEDDCSIPGPNKQTPSLERDRSQWPGLVRDIPRGHLLFPSLKAMDERL